MTDSPPRLSSHYSSTASLVSTDDDDEVHSFPSLLAADHQAALASPGEQRVSWRKKIWRFLTFANWRNRSSKASTKDDVKFKPLTQRKVEVGKQKVFSQSRREKWQEQLRKLFCLSKPLSGRDVSTKVARVFRRKSLPEPDSLGRVLFKLQYRKEDGDYQNRANALFRSGDDQLRTVRYRASRDYLEALMKIHVVHVMYPPNLQQLHYQQEQVDSAFKQMDEAVGLPNFSGEVPPGEANYRNDDSWQDSTF